MDRQGVVGNVGVGNGRNGSDWRVQEDRVRDGIGRRGLAGWARIASDRIVKERNGRIGMNRQELVRNGGDGTGRE